MGRKTSCYSQGSIVWVFLNRYQTRRQATAKQSCLSWIHRYLRGLRCFLVSDPSVRPNKSYALKWQTRSWTGPYIWNTAPLVETSASGSYTLIVISRNRKIDGEMHDMCQYRLILLSLVTKTTRQKTLGCSVAAPKKAWRVVRGESKRFKLKSQVQLIDHDYSLQQYRCLHTIVFSTGRAPYNQRIATTRHYLLSQDLAQ